MTRTFTELPLNDPRPDRNARRETANLDIGSGFERINGVLELRTKPPLIKDGEGFYTVEEPDAASGTELRREFLTVGSDFPPDPDPGQMHVHTGLEYETFVFDGARQKWLSIRPFAPSFTNQTTVVVGAQLRLFQGPLTSATFGFRLPYNCTLTDVEAAKGNTATATRFDIRAAGVVIKSHSMAAGDATSTETGINADFAAGDVVNVIIAVGDLTSGGTITCSFRRRP